MPTPHAARFLGLLSLLAVSAACAPVSSGELSPGLQGTVSGSEVRVDETLPSVLAFPQATVDDLWKALPAAFQALEIPAGIVDASARVYGNGRVTETTAAGESTRDLFRCGAGSGLGVSQYRVQFGITAQPRPVLNGGAELFVQIEAFGRLVSGSRTGTTHCVSNGSLELKIKEQMDIQLGRFAMR